MIDDVLDDKDFDSIVLETDRPNPNLAEAEVRFVPSQIPGGKFEIPDVYLSLDGCSLSIDDLGKLFFLLRIFMKKIPYSSARERAIQNQIDI